MLDQRKPVARHSRRAWIWAGIVIGFIVVATVVMLSGKPDIGGPYDTPRQGVR
jgi:hypothetical protein